MSAPKKERELATLIKPPKIEAIALLALFVNLFVPAKRQRLLDIKVETPLSKQAPRSFIFATASASILFSLLSTALQT